MRLLVFVLVLVNLLFYGLAAGLFGHPGNPDGGRVAQQVAADRVRIVARGNTPPPKGWEKQVAAAAEPEELCLVWDPLTAADAERLAVTLTEKVVGFRAERRNVASEGGGWWVFIPPLASRAEADKKAADLKQMEVSDYFIVPEAGPNRLAISLGVFSREERAQERLAELQKKGVKSAKVMQRPGKNGHVLLEVRGPVARQAELLDVAAGVMPDVAAQNCK